MASFLDELLAPPRLAALVDELRARGELAEVLAALDRGDEGNALELVLEAIPESTPDRREQLRDLAVAIFEQLGQDDPTTIAYRRRLATALY